jgi:MFS family permease
MLFLPKWGRFLDRYGSRPLLLITGTFTALTVLVWVPAVPETIVPMLIFNAIGGLIWCGNDITYQSMMLSHTREDMRSLSIAVTFVLCSIASASAFLTSGALLQWTRPFFENNTLMFLGARFDHYKLLFVITALIRLLATWIFVPRLSNEKDFTNAQVYKDVSARLAVRRVMTKATLRRPFRGKRNG